MLIMLQDDVSMYICDRILENPTMYTLETGEIITFKTLHLSCDYV